MRTTFEWTEETDEGDCIVHEIPARWEICSRCEGDGTHVNPNVDGHGITAEEWDRDWDDESREGYFRGDYDVPCHDCGGSGKVKVPDLDQIPGDLRERYEAHERAKAQMDAEARYWRRLEYGEG